MRPVKCSLCHRTLKKDFIMVWYEYEFLKKRRDVSEKMEEIKDIMYVNNKGGRGYEN